jgi:hypothetical protein
MQRLPLASLLGAIGIFWVAARLGADASGSIFTVLNPAGASLNHAPTPKKRLVETMSGGVALADFNQDGRLDLFLANGAAPASLEKTGPAYWNRLFIQTENGQFDDVTEAWHAAGSGHSIGASIGDFDGDGRPDLFVAGAGTSRLYRNEGTRLRDVTAESGIHVSGFAVGAAWLDFDRDGRLDLFVVRYVEWDPAREPDCGDAARGLRTYCHPREYRGMTNQLFRNLGDGRFAEVSEPSGVGGIRGKGMAAAVSDIDGDGDPDVFVTNDTEPNFLFENLGNGKFAERGLEWGVALNDEAKPVSSMGAHFGDYDGDGRLDLVVTALLNETFPLFRNGGKQFRDVTNATRMARLTLPLTGWGVAWGDFNRDGWLDLLVATGDVQDNTEQVSHRASRQRPQLLLGDGRTFRPEPLDAPAAQYRGLAVGDLNRDGALDAVLTRLGEPPILLLGKKPERLDWLGLELEGTRSSRDALGARVTLVLESGRSLIREVSTAAGYASSSSSAVHFGLGADPPKSIEIRWPSGRVQKVQPRLGRYQRVVED